MKYYWHKLMHLLGANTGRVVVEWHEGNLWVGFECDKCGEVTGQHQAPDHTYR